MTTGREETCHAYSWSYIAYYALDKTYGLYWKTYLKSCWLSAGVLSDLLQGKKVNLRERKYVACWKSPRLEA